MYYVYILRLANDQLYTGYTKDLQRRIKEHESGKSPFVSKHLPIKLLHYEAYLEQADALSREKFLKTTAGKALLRKQITQLLQKEGLLK